MKSFLNQTGSKKVVKKVRTKLGLRGVKEINETIVVLMLSACAWGVQKFSYPEDAKWCSLFGAEHQKVYDYYLDAITYYYTGPGNQINMDAGCPLLQDVFTNIHVITGTIKEKPKRKIIGRFGHSSTIFAPFHKLGLFIDRHPILVDNYEQMKDRKFRFGYIGPMSGNFAFVLYKCLHEQYKIQFYLNERLVKLPACHSKVSCSLDDFLRYYQPILDKCDYDRICKV